MTRTTLELTPLSPIFCTTLVGGRLSLTSDLTCNRPTYTADLQWNRVTNLKPSGPETKTLPLGHNNGHSWKFGEEDAHLGAFLFI
ncbi:hypothetical protein AVEN_188504-1 [Araneus ventricosus]|uniref:Uncharacterized protein n=1 Tax=Araneus ventricosus TaxID=182803 RepID=A0A4Y2M3Z7_ARAVE|nr:hypothetical protein AVEN_188504-1 [Araneus ventricosus]